MKYRNSLILFLADGNNNLHLMAEALARRAITGRIDVISASMTPPMLNPVTIRVMEEAGTDLSAIQMRSLLDVEPFQVDLIITLGNFDQDCRPTLTGMPPHLHWEVADPGKADSLEQVYDQLKIAREDIARHIQVLIESGLLHALFITRRNLGMILDHLMDGVMAHTTNRRIFFFNKAAEKITGYRREDILGKDCHDVFPGRFCGGDCEFCNRPTVGSPKKIMEKKLSFAKKNGRKIVLKMSIMPLTNEHGEDIGALLSFKDDTELDLLKRRIKHHHALGELIGKDPKTLELFEHIREVSSVDVSVLIEGESGTGKELVANAIHETGSRRPKPFVAVNCGALPEGILESELFGHESGAFTGARQRRKGRFELAHGGTLFLDEIGELSLAMQVKLLRVLQEKRVERLGGETSIPVDVRVISATNQNLRKLMGQKKFRKDLFYRLCVVPIMRSPLRERRLDIPVLVEHFLEMIASEIKRPQLIPSNEVLDFLDAYPWPGNVRELRNALEFAYVKCRTGIIGVEHLPPEISAYQRQRSTPPSSKHLVSKEKILVSLSQAGGNRKEAAKLLGIGRATLYRYLDAYGLK